MKGCRIVVQTSEGKDLYVKRIALPILSADKFTTVTMDMTVDIYEAIVAYQQSQKNKTSFQEEFDAIHNMHIMGPLPKLKW